LDRLHPPGSRACPDHRTPPDASGGTTRRGAAVGHGRGIRLETPHERALRAQTGAPLLATVHAHSSWVGARRVTLRHVSSRPPLSTGRAAFTASGAAPEVLLHVEHGASVSISVASTDVHPCLLPFRQPTLALWRGHSLRVRWVLCSPLTFVLRTAPG
jgi:hypothetical protein